MSVSNGTVALHLALLALGIKEGDEIIVPTFTYIASVNAIRYVGAKPVFVDSLKETWQIDPDDIKKRITPKTKAIIVVHLYGYMCDMDEIKKIARDNNLKIIEDSSEALGSKYKGRMAGTFGDIATFSFFGNKTITTGEGGMVVTNSQTLAEKISILKNQGIASDKEYNHVEIGYNFRMTNICAAIGLAQLEQVNEIISLKRKLALEYIDKLKNLPLVFIKDDANVYNSFWMVTARLKSKELRDELRENLLEDRIETRRAFPLVNSFPFYSGYKVIAPNAQILSDTGLNLPSYPSITAEEFDLIINSIGKFFKKNGLE